MIEEYLTDTVDIITRVFDEWGSYTDTTQEDVVARVEDKVQMVRDQTGKEVVSNIHIILDPDALVTYQSRFKIKTRCGEPAEALDKDWPVKALAKGHSFENLTWEVWL